MCYQKDQAGHYGSRWQEDVTSRRDREGRWKLDEFARSFYYVITSLFCLAHKCMLSVRSHTVLLLGCYWESALFAGSLKSGKTAAIHSEKWNHPPTSNTPGLIFDTWTPLFPTQLLLVPPISFAFPHLITLSRFNLYTSAKDSQVAFLKNIQLSVIIS